MLLVMKQERKCQITHRKKLTAKHCKNMSKARKGRNANLSPLNIVVIYQRQRKGRNNLIYQLQNGVVIYQRERKEETNC